MFEYMILPFRRFAEFTGRSRRKEFWMFTLLNIIVFSVLGVIAAATGAAMERVDLGDPLAPFTLLFSGSGILVLIWWLIVLVPSIAVTVRRLHDRDMSGWWYLGFIVASLIPLVGFIALIAFLVLMVLPGTAGPNRYGNDPRDPAGAEVFS